MTELTIAFSLAMIGTFCCSLFEAAFYSVPADYVESLVQQGRSAGRLLQRLRKDVHRPISAILILNTLATTAAGAWAGAAAAEAFGRQYVTAFSLFFCLMLLIFAEVIPKTAGVAYSRPISCLIAWPLHLLVRLLTPFVYLCQQFTRLVLWGKVEEHTVSDEELIVMARLGIQTGGVEPSEADVIENILGLERRTVREIMTPRSVVFELDADLSVGDARKQDGILRHSRIPVYDEDPRQVIGIVHRRQVLRELADDRPETTLEQLMKPVYFVTDTTELDELLTLFLERRQHLFAVIDEFGNVVGIVTLEDVLEEILGREITDESDQDGDPRELARRRHEEILGKQEEERPEA